MDKLFVDICIEDIKQIALDAGIATMEIYKQDFRIEYKEDQSPLTQADLKANMIICDNLQKLYPNIPLMSEENKEISYEQRKNWNYYWCIDPIDGTKEFIKKNDEFTINIALIHKNAPVLGVVYAPALGELYFAKKGEGAFFEKVNNHQLVNNSTKKLPFVQKENFQVVASKSHLSKETEAFIDELSIQYPLLKIRSRGSSLKLCMVATGEANIYPRLSPTMEWDTAAADAIVREAGKMTYQYHSSFDIQYLALELPLMYNKRNLLNPWFISR
jgi:3'(2'), 5'-bisphosphate nucleotidase